MKTGIRRLVILGVALGLLLAAAHGQALIPAAVEDTGQATCHDASGATTDPLPCAGTGQDGELRAGLAWPTPRFTDHGDGTVTDNLTGLVWLQDASCTGEGTLQAALDWVASLNTTSIACLDYAAGTFTDWRLPNINELASLADYGRFNPALPAGHPFARVQSSSYWSSTTAPDDPDQAFRYLMSQGEPSVVAKDGSAHPWPVRGGPGAAAAPAVILADGGLEFPDGSVQTTAARPVLAPVEKTGQQTCWDASGATGNEITCDGTGQDGELRAGVAWPMPRFTDNGDGTVTDNLTGLVWLKDANCPGGPMTLQAALAWVGGFNAGSPACTNYIAGTFTDWRLPNVKELLSLMDRSRSSPPLPSGHPFVNVQTFVYWSSTSRAAIPTFAWTGGMFRGAAYYLYSKTSALPYVWPVRGGR